MAEYGTCKERLADLRARMHELMLQREPTRVSYGDRSVEFSNFVTTTERLNLAIRALEQDPECGEFGRRRRPFYMSDL